jgi:hypothetical protein
MNWCSKCFRIATLAGVFVIASEMPLLARPQQSAQSNTAAPKDDSLPDAPQLQTLQAQDPQATQQPTQAPTGAAAAKSIPVKGAPVAQPVGAAVAPARQRGHRSLLIKVGLLLGGGIAVGTVVALSERSPTRPPGTASSNHP